MSDKVTASTILGDFLIQRGKVHQFISFHKFSSFFPKTKRRSKEVAKLYRQLLKRNKRRLAVISRNIELENTLINTKIKEMRQKELVEHINDEDDDDDDDDGAEGNGGGGGGDFEHMAFKALFGDRPDPHAPLQDLETINDILSISIDKVQQDLLDLESESNYSANLIKTINDEFNDVTYSKSDGQQQIQEAIHAVNALYDQVRQLNENDTSD